MVIVFVIDYLRPETNGLVISTRRLVEALRARGHTVRVLAYGASGKDAFALGERWIPLVSYFARKQKVSFGKFNKRVAMRALEGADVVHLLMPFRLSYRVARLAKRMGVPVTAAFHVHPENIIRNAGLRRPPKFLTKAVFWTWRKHLYDKVAAVHCPSEFIAGELRARHYESKLLVVSNGVGAEFRPKDIERDDDRHFQILMVGRLATEKRQDLLIRAVAEMENRDDIRVVFAGGGPRRRALARMARKYLPGQTKFVFCAARELSEVMNRSDLYVHAADVEVEGVSCLEAISCGLVPLIARANKSATRQFILDERCGFAAGSATDLARKIDYFVKNPKEMRGIRQEYLEFAKKFDLKYTTIELERMFKDVTKK